MPVHIFRRVADFVGSLLQNFLYFFGFQVGVGRQNKCANARHQRRGAGGAAKVLVVLAPRAAISPVFVIAGFAAQTLVPPGARSDDGPVAVGRRTNGNFAAPVGVACVGILAGAGAHGDHVGVRGVKIDVVQIVIPGSKQDHAAFSAAAFPRGAGNGFRFQGAELVSLIGAAPTATDDVCSVFDAVIEHLVGGAHGK